MLERLKWKYSLVRFSTHLPPIHRKHLDGVSYRRRRSACRLPNNARHHDAQDGGLIVAIDGTGKTVIRNGTAENKITEVWNIEKAFPIFQVNQKGQHSPEKSLVVRPHESCPKRSGPNLQTYRDCPIHEI